MNEARLPLLVNPMPVWGLLFGIVRLGFGLLHKTSVLGTAALATLVLASLSTLVANQSGKAAEEVVEEMGCDPDPIHAHEEAVDLAL
jgi:hypothetical protein